MASQRMAYEQWFYDADTDKNGYLTKKELRKALKSKGYRVTSKQFKVRWSYRKVLVLVAENMFIKFKMSANTFVYDIA